MKDAFEKALKKKLKDEGVKDEWIKKHLVVMTLGDDDDKSKRKKSKKA